MFSGRLKTSIVFSSRAYSLNYAKTGTPLFLLKWRSAFSGEGKGSPDSSGSMMSDLRSLSNLSSMDRC